MAERKLDVKRALHHMADHYKKETATCIRYALIDHTVTEPNPEEDLPSPNPRKRNSQLNT
ncbi:MAG: hypothetical protein L6R41_002507 [Letrouitia leprolyta]|nr:MAG: hypothetical protein L6R41_002507 [Letrouitia leprolyta]